MIGTDQLAQFEERVASPLLKRTLMKDVFQLLGGLYFFFNDVVEQPQKFFI